MTCGRPRDLRLSIEVARLPIPTTVPTVHIHRRGHCMAAITLANRLANYAASLTFEKLTTEAIHETKRRFIDSFATAVGAMPSEAYAIAKKCALRVSSNPGASLLGGGRSSVEWATFVNGLLIRYLDFNDTYLSKEPAHPSDNLAAVLAVGEAVGAERPRPHHRRRAGLRDPVPVLRRRQPAQTRRRSRHLRGDLLRGRGGEADETRRDETHARGRPRRRVQRRAAADAIGRTEHVEGLRVRQRRPQRRLRRDARGRGADRPGPDLRGRSRLLQTRHARSVRPRAVRRRVRQHDGS